MYNVFCYKSGLLFPPRKHLQTRTFDFFDSVEKKYKWITWIGVEWDIGPLQASRPLGPILKLELPTTLRNRLHISEFSYYNERMPLWSTMDQRFRVIFVTHEQAKSLDSCFKIRYIRPPEIVRFHYDQNKSLEENINDIQQLFVINN